MIPNIEKGRGVTGAVRYVLGQGKDKLTGAWLTLNEGETSRAQIIGGQNFPFTIDSLERLDLARRMMEFNARRRRRPGLCPPRHHHGYPLDRHRPRAGR